MPTNVSTPIWQCDICLTKFGQDEARAHLCESAGAPADVPDGTVLLRQDREVAFTLTRMHPTDRIDSDMQWAGTTPGHHRLYTVDAFPGVRFSGKSLYPLKAGHLHVRTEPNAAFSRFARTEQFPTWPAAVVGLPAAGVRVALEWFPSAYWVAPITEPVRAVFDALEVSLQTIARRGTHLEEFSYELGTRGDRGWEAAAAVALGDRDQRVAAMRDLQVAWFAGQDVHAPKPALTSPSTRTASKLTKALAALVEATGVPWETRTSATEYVNTLMRRKLMTTTSPDTRLFAGPKVIAVGSVKGGVGKSTTAAALGAALAATGVRTGVVDLDLSGPSQHLLWNLGPVPVDKGAMTLKLTATDVPHLSVFSHGQLGGGLPARWSDQTSAQWVTFLGGVLDVSDLDVIVLDMPPGRGYLDDLVMGDDHKLDVDVAVHVTTADQLSLSDVRTGLALDLHATQHRILVENMSRALGTTADGQQVPVRLKGSEQDVRDLAREFHIEYGGSLPWATAVTDLAGSDEMVALAAAVRVRVAS